MSFELDLRRFSKNLIQDGRDAIRKTTIATYGGIIRSTRVDTGRARLNWNVNLGSINYDTRGEPKGSPTRNSMPNGQETRESGLQTATMRLKAGDISDVYISNDLHYIGKLEKMDHMVRDTVKEVQDKINKGALDD